MSPFCLPPEKADPASSSTRFAKPTRIKLIANRGFGHGQRTSRRRDDELYDPSKPVVLHEGIVDDEVATAGVLTEFGFEWCDLEADTWYHLYAQFQCRSDGGQCCRWERDTIFRCSVTTEIIRRDHDAGLVKDLEPLGSLHHPPCLNHGCRLSLKTRHIMRLEKKQLVSRELSDPEKTALSSRKRGKWFGTFQDIYPMPVGVMPFSRDPDDGPMKKKRKRRLSSHATSSSMTDHPRDQQSALPSTPVSLPDLQTVETARQNTASAEPGSSRPQSIQADSGRLTENDPSAASGPPHPQTGPITEPIAGDVYQEQVPKAEAELSVPRFGTTSRQINEAAANDDDAEEARDIKPVVDADMHGPPTQSSRPRQTSRADSSTDVDINQDITRITDHYLISHQEFNRSQAEMIALRTRVAELEREADRSRDEARQAVEREAEVKRVAREERMALESKVKAVEQEKANWKSDRAILERQINDFKEEARAAKDKMEELRTKGRQLFA